MAKTPPLFQLRQVRKSYGQRTVLDIPALELYEGETLAVVGPSGAGKNTLLRLLNFLETPDSGVLSAFGYTLSPERPVPLELRRKVTTVFQRPALLRRSVRQNITYGLHLRGKYDEQAHIDSLLEVTGLLALADSPAHTLSGGEMQRVALVRAAVLRPRVLLLDEPTANLDPYNVGLIEMLLRRLNQEEQTTLVLVTHQLFQAQRLAQRVAFLLDGQLIEIAAVERFFSAANDARTAAFVGGKMVY
jgi:tungstate transport system ATP-binding protein